jgi:PAS domain-containing protein
MRQAWLIYRGVFAQSPNAYLILTLELRIVEANDAYLTATLQRRDTLVGRDLFEAFPDNPGDTGACGVRNLTASLERACRQLQRDAMPLQRYDVRSPDGKWRRRYWHPVNWTIVDERRSVIAIVHHVVDATSEIAANQRRRRRPLADLIAEASRKCGTTWRLCSDLQSQVHRMRSVVERSHPDGERNLFDRD